MRQDIAFNAEGTTLRGWLYTPDAGKGPFPTVVMAHGFSAVKEMYLDSFAEAFAAFNQAREPKKLVVLPPLRCLYRVWVHNSKRRSPRLVCGTSD